MLATGSKPMVEVPEGTINTKGQVTGSVGGAGTGMYIQKTKNLKSVNKCQAITKSGNRCSRNSNSRSDYCSQHNKYDSQTNSNLENYIGITSLKLKLTSVQDQL